MMEMEQTAGSCPTPGQAAVRTVLPPNTRGAPGDATSRFHGEGVRYKAKIIGVDTVPTAQGEKMCWDSMMKLKGCEAAARKQGRHKQRVWLKISSSGLRIIDERTGGVMQDHDRTKISSLTKDESDPRALAYIYQYQDACVLFYIRTANLADPVLTDIRMVCEGVDQETPQQPVEPQTQTSSLLLINDSSAPPTEGAALEELFSPRPEASAGQPSQASSSNELMEVFAIPMQDPLLPPESSCAAQPEPPSPKPVLSTSQILSMFPTQQPVGVPPYASPPYSPTSPMPYGQQGPMGNQWAGPAVAPWPTMPANMAGAWAPAAPPAGGMYQAHCPQPGVMAGGNRPVSPVIPNGYPYPPTGATGPMGATQPVSPSLDDFLLG